MQLSRQPNSLEMVIEESICPVNDLLCDVLACRHRIREVHPRPHPRLPTALLQMRPCGEAQSRVACWGHSWLHNRATCRPCDLPVQLIAAQVAPSDLSVYCAERCCSRWVPESYHASVTVLEAAACIGGDVHDRAPFELTDCLLQHASDRLLCNSEFPCRTRNRMRRATGIVPYSCSVSVIEAGEKVMNRSYVSSINFRR